MLDLSKRDKLLSFSGVLVVLFLASLNLTVVGTALPRIIAEFDGFALYAWAFTAYSLTSTVSLPICGKLSDIYGRKVVLLAGIVAFSLASVLSGFSQTMLQLILFRALQGFGGAALISMAWATLGDIFTPRERGKYQGFNGAVFGVSSVVGPIVGGLITDTLGWRWVFFVNVPVAAFAFAFIYRFLPTGARNARSHVDYLGSLLLMLGVTPLLLALTWGGVDYGWTSVTILGLFAVSAGLLGLFVGWQFRSPHPILEPGLFRNRTFRVANSAGFLSAIGLFGAIIYLPLYIQGVQGGSAAASSFVLTPLMGGLVLSSTLAGLLVTRTGRYKVYILSGLATMVVAFYLLSTMDTATPIWLTTAYTVLLGLGIGPTNSLFMLAVQNALPGDKLGVVTSANQFFRQIGGTVGVTVFGAIVAASVRTRLATGLPEPLRSLSPETLTNLTSPNLLTDPGALERTQRQVEAVANPDVFDVLLQTLRSALAAGLSQVFMWTAVTAAVALVVAALLPQHELRSGPAASPQKRSVTAK